MVHSVFQVMIANIIYLFLSAINNFLLPKYLSIDTYAQIKTYALFMSYAGFLHLGFNDGMYLKYGGKSISKINKGELETYFKSYLFLELTISFVTVFISFILRNKILLFFAIGFVFNNIIALFQNLYQSTGEFKKYGNILYVRSIVILIINFVLIRILHIKEFSYYIVAQIGVDIIISLYFSSYLNVNMHLYKKGYIKIKCITEMVRNGFVLMIGNISGKIFTSIDRWMIKFLLLAIDFSQYSFAVSVDSLVNAFISPITVVLYNKFCITKNYQEIKSIKNILLIWNLFIISLAFPAKYVIYLYLPEYKNSVNIIYILLLSQVFSTIVKGVYVNLYKAEKKQKTYFKQTMVMIIISFVLNIISYVINKNIQSFAFATAITNFIWLVICERYYKCIRFERNAIIVCFMELIIFSLLGYYVHSLLGLSIYILTLLINLNVFMKEYLKKIIIYLKEFVINR